MTTLAEQMAKDAALIASLPAEVKRLLDAELALIGRDREDTTGGRDFTPPTPIPSDLNAQARVLLADYKIALFLEILLAMGGDSDASDGPGNWTAAFCDDGTDPDTYNLSENRGLSRTTHDGMFDTSTVRITDAGRAWLNSFAPNGVLTTALARSERVEGPITEIADERLRQIKAEGWMPEHDDAHRDGELAKAAACYALSEQIEAKRAFQRASYEVTIWPWDDEWWKPKDRRSDLIRAGALIVAEIERLDRAAIGEGAGR